jgi:hypothetical protein
MNLIEIGPDTFLNVHSICTITVETREKTKRANLGYGRRGRSRKIGETFTLLITTLDGGKHRLTEEFSAQAYDALFPRPPE